MKFQFRRPNCSQLAAIKAEKEETIVMDFFAKRRKERAEKKREEGTQRRAQILEGLKEETAPHLRILRGIRDEFPRESRRLGSHEFHFNTWTHRTQVDLITSKLRVAEIGTTFYFDLKDIGISKEELHDIWLAAVRADVIVDGPEFGLKVTERPNSRSFVGNVVGSVDDIE